jgi:3-hydroxyethyl bacteriochlorophyllide a dehydrogenase
MQATAVVLDAPGRISVQPVEVTDPGAADIVVEVACSGISTGTEKLLWSGRMPPFPGMGYPLVPGYESFGEVVAAGPEARLRPGDMVFVPGAACYGAVRGLFGGAASHLVTAASRAVRLDRSFGAEGALLALAATARHAIAAPGARVPDLIVGHGVLGRLLARLTIAAGAPAPTVWETDPARTGGAAGYRVTCADADPRRDYASIYDATGDAGLIDSLVMRLSRGGEIVLAGFYPDPIRFAFPPSFLKEARFRVAAEWTADDLAATRALLESGALSLGGLITHRAPAADAAGAYATAFADPSCLKMILDWKGPQ